MLINLLQAMNKELIENLISYIEYVETVIWDEWGGEIKSTQQLIDEGKMPDEYYELRKLLEK